MTRSDEDIPIGTKDERSRNKLKVAMKFTMSPNWLQEHSLKEQFPTRRGSVDTMKRCQDVNSVLSYPQRQSLISSISRPVLFDVLYGTVGG